MVAANNQIELPKLNAEQASEGYWLERYENNVLVWHNKNQVALLVLSPDIEKKVQDTVEKRRRELKEVEEKTGWKANR